jgi:uncharacterized RmlC-like cupin family protein
MSQSAIKLIRPADRTLAAAQTAGMIREAAVETREMWAGIARTQPGNRSDWHHHGQWDTVAYVITGAVHLEFGPGGREVVEAHPGDFIFIPEGEIHRESNPSTEEQRLVIVRRGSGPVVVNVDGPAHD